MEPVNFSNLRVRIAPSPTGFMHIGNLKVVLYDYLLARHHKGTFIVRIEDTDQSRFVPGAIEDLLRTLTWAGFAADEGPYLDEQGIVREKGDYGPYIQSKRLPIYHEHIKTLLDKRKAYYCFCSKERLDALREDQTAKKLPPKYDGLCRDLSDADVKSRLDKGESHVIRLRIPENRDITYNDLIRGPITFNSNDLDDLVLIKADGFPTYHFANVVDDHLMKITLVLRGEEWISSTPKHLLMYEAFGWHPPQYAHVPQVLNKDKKKMSKRQGDVSVRDFVNKGYLRDALINFLALLGWNSGTEQEFYTMDELIKQFSLDKVHKAGGVFDLDKLDWLNGYYIRELSIDEFVKQSLPFLVSAGLLKQDGDILYNGLIRKKTVIAMPWLKRICALEQPRVKRLADLPEAVAYFFESNVKLDKDLLVWKKSTPAQTKQILENVIPVIENIDDHDFMLENLEKRVREFIEYNNYQNGDVLWPIRYALSGREKSPSPFELITVMGKEMTIKRLTYALKKFKTK